MATYDSWGNDSERFADGSLCIGIDLGTTNSCVGLWLVERNHVKILKNREDRGRTTPSVVHFLPDSDSVVVGNAALAQRSPAGNTIRSVKRLLGQPYKSKAVSAAKSFAAYDIVATPQGNAAVEISRRGERVRVQPEEVSSHVLAELKASAEAYWPDGSTRIDNAVITVPAYFSDAQRTATLLSAEMAGFKAVRLLNEPTAAAMAYGLFVAGDKTVVVVDFGGGTLDVSLMHINDGLFEVLGIGGDTHLGGDDVTHVLMEHVLENVQKHHREVTRSALSAGDLAQLRRVVEDAKIALSTEDETELALSQFAGIASFTLRLTRRKLELLGDGIWKRCLRILSNVLAEADVAPHDVDEVIMVGGSTRIPILRAQISEFFGGKELCLSVNADEVVCEGAAIQAAILSGMDRKVFRDVLMMDVIPLSIGLEKADGTMEVLLPKNSRIPVTVTKYFETFEDDQPGLSIDVYEGEHEVAKENDHICLFNFAIPRDKIAKAGAVAHPVTFTMNASGVLQVQAGIHHDSEEAPMSTTALVLMALYIAALFALYVFSRIYFASDRDLTLT
ncbi:hypothetical protein ATCC90586_010463 [Pythium insidiosum]|nr:hypothetical protein ATCC90586_010463 [Pythium insidiosum]